MAKTILLNDGTNEVIFSRQDFQRLIYDKLGSDAENELIAIIKESDYTQKKVATDLDSYEASLEQAHCVLNDMLDELENMRKIIESKRIDKQKLIAIVNGMERQISYEI